MLVFISVLGISILLNIPKFFEAETMVEFRTTEDGVNITQTRMGITDTRIHPNYITYYIMWTRLLAIGIFPLAMLAILNTKIYLALRRSKAQLRSMAIRSALPMAILGKNLQLNSLKTISTSIGCVTSFAKRSL